MVYSESEIERIAIVAFELAMKRNKRLCSVGKSNVLEVYRLWEEVVNRVAKQFPDVQVEHMYVDNAAMQLISQPKYFDTIVTGPLHPTLHAQHSFQETCLEISCQMQLQR